MVSIQNLHKKFGKNIVLSGVNLEIKEGGIFAVLGPNGSGKTTMMNALSQYISERERIVTIEDAAELRLQQPHIVRLETGGDILRIPPGTFHRSVSDPDGSVVLNQAVREEGASVVREFRVYNSRVIPRLFATTFKTAPLPKLHGVSW